MATGTIILPIGGAVQSDGSASNAAPALQRVQSSGASPKPHFLQLAFDATTQEFVQWQFRLPANYASTPVIKAQYKMASATTGGVVIEVRVLAVSDGDSTDVDAAAYSTANTSAGSTVPGTAGYLDEISLSLSNVNSWAAGDYVSLLFSRAPADANDTATGDMEVIAVSLEYTTT